MQSILIASCLAAAATADPFYAAYGNAWTGPPASPPPDPPLLASAVRALSTEPVPMPTERGALMLTLMPSTATATDFPLPMDVVSLPTLVLPPPSLPGPPRDSTVLSATTMARGLLTLRLMPSTATATLLLAPAVSLLPGPLLLALATRALSTEPAPTSMERGVLMLMLGLIPTTATDTVVPTAMALATTATTMVVTTAMDTVMATATATTDKLELSC